MSWTLRRGWGFGLGVAGIRALLAHWDQPPTSAVMVGDYLFDLQAGRAAGTVTSYADLTGEFPFAEHADVQVRDLDALRAARAALERQGAEICPHLPGELPLLARYAAAQVRDLQIDSPVARLADLPGLPGTAASDHPAWNGLAALLTTQKGEWRKTLTRREGFPTDKSAGDGHTQAEMKRRMLALLGDLARAPDLAAQLRGLCALPPPTYDEGQWAVLEALLSLLPQAVARLREEFAASGRVDYVEVALAALRTLEGGEAPGRDAPGDAAGLTEANIRHVLVDEFQDTDPLQIEIAVLLASSGPAEGVRWQEAPMMAASRPTMGMKPLVSAAASRAGTMRCSGI
ncbi:MAG: UvrD-helicase domain-containing protein [Proteobacteria bacterium]|nr:UvrD-helicase domain-containing protein [Pseudomonadota bacterium]